MEKQASFILAAIVFCAAILFGCCINPPTSDGGGIDTLGHNDQTGQGEGGQIIVVQQNASGGMSDPSKCNNLPPQQMADCLSQSMGN